MKKLISILISVTLLFGLFTTSLGVNSIEVNKPTLTQMQIDILLSLGVNQEMIPTLLPKEISALLVKGDIIYPEYLDPYLPSEEELQSDLKKSEEEMAAAKERFEAIGGTGEEVRVYLKTTESSVYDILTMPADKLRQAKKLSSYQLAQSMIAPRSINTNYTTRIF